MGLWHIFTFQSFSNLKFCTGYYNNRSYPAMGLGLELLNQCHTLHLTDNLSGVFDAGINFPSLWLGSVVREKVSPFHSKNSSHSLEIIHNFHFNFHTLFGSSLHLYFGLCYFTLLLLRSRLYLGQRPSYNISISLRVLWVTLSFRQINILWIQSSSIRKNRGKPSSGSIKKPSGFLRSCILKIFTAEQQQWKWIIA